MIDTSLDLRSDASGDADTYSPTMRRYHRLLWSKPLPGGAMFDLEEAGRKGSYYLRHNSDLGEFKLSSDAITNRLLKRARRVVAQIPPKQLPPHRGYTIGSALLFPKTAPPGRMTINKARGMHPESPTASTSPWSASVATTKVKRARLPAPCPSTRGSSSCSTTSLGTSTSGCFRT